MSEHSPTLPYGSNGQIVGMDLNQFLDEFMTEDLPPKSPCKGAPESEKYDAVAPTRAAQGRLCVSIPSSFRA